MQKIKKLSDQEAKKIAAGEVVERPANIVKELIENSIDAGSQNISIYIEDAGKKLIRIIDDGCGMSFDDAKICFDHHATSKISSVEDLNNLKTFGFRGEALSSISSISKVQLITKESNQLQGIKIKLEDGKVIDQNLIGCNSGTEFNISELFYNIPARLKFLKKNETEWRQILNIFYAFTLSHLNIHFKLFNENTEVYNCPKTTDLTSRIAQLLGHNFSQNLIEFSETNNELKLQIFGAISNHQFNRFNRNQIYFFVNNRWIKNQNLLKALLKGYLNVLQEGRFPAGFVFINIDPSLIDVNIHPRKEEVQFINSTKIEKFIQETVKKTLESFISKQLKTNISFNSNINFEKKVDEPQKFIGATFTSFDFEQLPFFEPFDSYSKLTEIITENNFNKSDSQSLQQHENPEQFVHTQINLEKNFEIIGQYNKTYILLEKEEGLLLVDQHAAHERILYELFSKKFHDVATVKLLFPIFITLTENDINLIFEHLELLQQNGIYADVFSKTQLVIYSTPVHIKDIKLDEFIRQIISWIEESNILDRQEFFKLINEKIHAQMACKAAIKAGDILSKEQMIQLLNDLDKVENKFTCPHGRPTNWFLSLNDIERKFKRIK